MSPPGCLFGPHCNTNNNSSIQRIAGRPVSFEILGSRAGKSLRQEGLCFILVAPCYCSTMFTVERKCSVLQVAGQTINIPDGIRQEVSSSQDVGQRMDVGFVSGRER